MITVHSTKGSPEPLLNQLIEGFSRSSSESSYAAIRYELCQYYLPDQPLLPLLAVVCLRRDGEGLAFKVAVQPDTSALRQALKDESLAQLDSLVWHDFARPLQLEPIAIAKPWGQEIWYTGIEQRGQSQVAGEGGCTPLPWLLSVAPKRLAGGMERDLCLLKVLDPLPDEVYGDLYFEMHEQKQEVYVVTYIDPNAWPSGTGGIRFGFNQALRKSMGQQAFAAAYAEAVERYRQVRREIDAEFDRLRQRQGLSLNEPVSAEQLKLWFAKLPDSLQREECDRRQAMERFTAIKPLQLGDVVKVPTLTPHSLQHGVRTVEFQTPVYERKILSFAQKVLTQSEWDTSEALQKVNFEAPQEAPLECLSEREGMIVEQVVRFSDFEVLRLTLEASSAISLAEFAVDKPYALLMGVSGAVALADAFLRAQQAWLLPPALLEASVRVDESSVLLLALPVVE